MVFYAVVSDEADRAIDFFRAKRDAELMLAGVLRDEPDWRDILHVESIELESGTAN